MRPVGFSTGAVAYADFERALQLLSHEPVSCVELSALRYHEVTHLLASLPSLNLHQYRYVAFHAPSRFNSLQEEELSGRLLKSLPDDWTIVLHPDTIHSAKLWLPFGRRLAIENMDRRKQTGRTVEELQRLFDCLPEASLCFDIGHARQCDTSMTEAYEILRTFQTRIRQLHVSDVNTRSQHDRISYAAKLGFKKVARLIPETTPVIIESRVCPDEIAAEIDQVLEALPLRSDQPVAV